MKLRRKPKDSAEKQEPKKQKPKGTLVDKFNLTDNVVKLYAAKGFGKKQWVSIREIPVLEIEKIEKFGNELIITWKGATDQFYTKEKTDSFGKLVDQVNGILEEHRREVDAAEKAALRQSELLSVIEKSLGILDASFDILIGLQDKRINWQQLEAYANGFDANLNFAGQTLPPLSLDYGKIMPAVKTQVPKEASAEAFNLLKATYGYFDGLNPDIDLKDTPPTVQTTKKLIYTYFLLNDLLLGKAVGEKDNSREAAEFDVALQNLSGANFKADVERLKVDVDEMNAAGDKKQLIADSRAAFKEQLRHITEKPVAPPETPPQTEPTPQPMPQPAPQLETSEPIAAAQEPAVLLETPTQTEPTAQPVPEPTPQPSPQPEPEPTPQQEPQPAPQPEASEPVVTQEPAAEPAVTTTQTAEVTTAEPAVVTATETAPSAEQVAETPVAAAPTPQAEVSGVKEKRPWFRWFRKRSKP